MTAAIEKIRNIGIVAHIDAGKTTTTERILYYTGASHRMGNVDSGDTETDFDPEEAERGITIYSAAVSCQWKDVAINIIDTPGHVDFTAEVERSLRVLDGAVVIFSAVEGVEAQSETVWRQADKYNVPRICFVNKLDRIGASYERTLGQIEKRLAGRPLVLQLPIGSEDELQGVIDLIEQKALYFDAESKGEKIDARDIPDEYAAAAAAARQALLESASLFDDDLLTALIEESDVPSDKLRAVIRAATLTGKVQPTFCGASLDYIGVQPVLDAVAHYLPSPLDRPPVTGIHPNPKKRKDDAPELRKPATTEPVCGLVFKIVAEQHADLAFFRVYSGTLKSGSRLLNPRLNEKDLVSQIWRVQASHREKIDEAHAGDIVALIGPKTVVTGDTLCDQHKPIVLESITFPETVISMAVEPDSSAERKKLADVLDRLARQDPTFNARISEETGQTIISGMGELHLEVIRHKMERDFNLQVRVHKPRVSYRETVKKAVEATGEFHRKTGETVQFARIKLSAEPFDGKESVTVINKLKPGDLAPAFQEAALQTIRDASQSGGSIGFPLMKVRFTLLDADYREGETTEVAVQAAAAEAVQKALDAAGVLLLEPIMDLEVVTPEAFLGNIQADLNARRAIIVNSERRGDLCVLEAHAALAQMFGYSTQVRSLSQGRASYSMEPLKYDQAPPEVLREMLGE